MNRASPVSRAEFSHENLFMTVTDNFESTLCFPHNKTRLTELSNVISVVFHGQYKVFF